jgi:hypothetical protein
MSLPKKSGGKMTRVCAAVFRNELIRRGRLQRNPKEKPGRVGGRVPGIRKMTNAFHTRLCASTQ